MIDLKMFEKKELSQYGEDGVLEKIFEIIGTTNKYFVEFGSAGLDESMGNTAYLRKFGFDGLLMNASSYTKPKYDVKIHKVNAENIEELFVKYDVPEQFDLLSIDIDGNDYYVWKSIKNYNPRVVIIEINGGFPSNCEWIQKYNPDWVWGGNHHYGASYYSMCKLGESKGYSPIYCNSVNLVFVQDVYKEFFDNATYMSCYGADEIAAKTPQTIELLKEYYNNE